MKSCTLESVLRNLRKSSQEAINNAKGLSEFSQYMHVERDVETDLRKIISDVKMNQRKSLILVCGSAGDGKSHLLAYLKDQTDLLDDIDVINDATESMHPEETAIDRLNVRLERFSDENIEQPGKSMLIAINLGVLNNFIDSEYAERYKKLVEYVDEKSILRNAIGKSGDDEGVFKYVSFSDYNMFTLTKNGVETEYILSIFDKVLGQYENSPFYQAYKTHTCSMHGDCPIYNNYKFLMNKNVQEWIAQLLVRGIIEDKEILTTRELLNFIYDIIVPADYDESLFIGNSKLEKKCLAYINASTPSLLFESSDISSLISSLQKYDPTLHRTNEIDNEAIQYFVTEDITGIIEESLKDTPYIHLFTFNERVKTIINSEKDKRPIKEALYKLKTKIDAIYNSAPDELYNAFITCLYESNKKDGFSDDELSSYDELYDDAINAAKQWAGEYDGKICVRSKFQKWDMYEGIDYIYDEENRKIVDTDVFKRFSLEVDLGYCFGSKRIKLSVDYPLFKLIQNLKSGYIYTNEDVNNFANFIRFIDEVVSAGEAEKSVTIRFPDGKLVTVTRVGTKKFKYEVKS